MDLSVKEKKFADEYIFQFFHSQAVTPNCGVRAAKLAGYILTGDSAKDDATIKSILEKSNVKEYIDAEINRFRAILSDHHSRGLWLHISNYNPDEQDAEETTGSSTIYLH